MLPIFIIAALSENRVIGYKGQIPWKLSSDFKYFKKITLNSPIIMGRKTWDSLGKKILPNRANIVVSRQNTMQEELEKTGAFYATSLKSAYEIANYEAKSLKADAIFVIGGEAIYLEALKDAKKIFLTKVPINVEGDSFFPNFSEIDFKKISSEFVKAGERDDYDMYREVYERDDFS